MIRKISLPVSAQECAASATMDADPVSIAATDLATAIRRFAPNATSTVSVLSVSVDELIGTIASGAPPRPPPYRRSGIRRALLSGHGAW